MLFLLFLIVIGFIAWMGVSYNRLQKLAQEVKEKDSNIGVAVSKKINLINQLIDTVKGYQQGEQLVHLKISQDASGTTMLNSYQQSGTVLASVKGMAESFPNLKSNEHYLRLMSEINSCELNIQRNRELYNGSVKNYNTTRLTIPVVFIAQSMGFSEAHYKEFDQAGANDVTIKEFKTDDGERLKQLFSNAGSQIIGATKVIANQAVSSGKLLSDKFTDKKVESYFYVAPGGIPKGPIPSNELVELLNTGKIQPDTMVAPAGSDTWESIAVLKAAPEL